MKYLFLLLFFLFIVGCKTTGEYVATLSEKEDSPYQNIYAQVQQIELEEIPDNPPVHPEVVYKGVTADQWKIIDQIGDPLNCRKKVYDLQRLDLASFYELTPQQCSNQKDCIKSALQDHDRVLLREGVYTLDKSNLVMTGKILMGHPDETVIIDAQNLVHGFMEDGYPKMSYVVSIHMNRSILANIILQNAMDIGISTGPKNLIYRTVVGNSGVFSTESVLGIGIENNVRLYYSNFRPNFSENNCIVSTESYNGFGNRVPPFTTIEECPGCNADGYTVMHDANNVTIIDSHGHHNGDHGFDFYGGGVLGTFDSPIRVFYSSGTYSGKNPYRRGGDGGGWKLDGDKEQSTQEHYDIGRMLYGNISCFNLDHGFSKPGVTKLAFINNDHQEHQSKRGNSILANSNYDTFPLSFWGNAQTDDPYVLKCEDFKKIKTIRSFDIPLEDPKYYVVN